MFPGALLLLLLAAGCVKSQTLTQPGSVTVQPGHTLTITCQVSYSLGTWTAFIRQPAGKGLEWIGVKGTGGSFYKDSLRNKFSIDLDTSRKTVTLTGQNMQPGDSAVYYCAREFGVALDYWGKGTRVVVHSGPAPQVFPVIQCNRSAGAITVGCLAKDFNRIPFKWTDASGNILQFVQYPAAGSNSSLIGLSVINVKKAEWDSGKQFRCSLDYPGSPPSVTLQVTKTSEEPKVPPAVTTKVPPAVTTKVPPVVTTKGREIPKVEVFLPPEADIAKTNEVRLVCLVSGSGLDRYKIVWSEQTGTRTGRYERSVNVSTQKTGKENTVTSIYNTTKAKWNDRYLYECRIFLNGVTDPINGKEVSKANGNSLECR